MFDLFKEGIKCVYFQHKADQSKPTQRPYLSFRALKISANFLASSKRIITLQEEGHKILGSFIRFISLVRNFHEKLVASTCSENEQIPRYYAFWHLEQ